MLRFPEIASIPTVPVPVVAVPVAGAAVSDSPFASAFPFACSFASFVVVESVEKSLLNCSEVKCRFLCNTMSQQYQQE